MGEASEQWDPWLPVQPLAESSQGGTSCCHCPSQSCSHQLQTSDKEQAGSQGWASPWGAVSLSGAAFHSSPEQASQSAHSISSGWALHLSGGLRALLNPTEHSPIVFSLMWKKPENVFARHSFPQQKQCLGKKTSQVCQGSLYPG